MQLCLPRLLWGSAHSHPQTGVDKRSGSHMTVPQRSLTFLLIINTILRRINMSSPRSLNPVTPGLGRKETQKTSGAVSPQPSWVCRRGGAQCGRHSSMTQLDPHSGRRTQCQAWPSDCTNQGTFPCVPSGVDGQGCSHRLLLGTRWERALETRSQLGDAQHSLRTHRWAGASQH